jgi:chromosome segregation protein
MTAVALLFSIYMVKPSPFCVLDELDAPLDESNIGRFLNMLDQFIDKSQFVIVTHNKKTMRRADVMYGITMEEFGVSKPVGVKLTKEDEAQESARRAARAEAVAAAAARSAAESSAAATEEPSAPEPPADASEPAMAS